MTTLLFLLAFILGVSAGVGLAALLLRRLAKRLLQVQALPPPLAAPAKARDASFVMLHSFESAAALHAAVEHAEGLLPDHDPRRSHLREARRDLFIFLERNGARPNATHPKEEPA